MREELLLEGGKSRTTVGVFLGIGQAVAKYSLHTGIQFWTRH
jgi:hypothetical protein